MNFDHWDRGPLFLFSRHSPFDSLNRSINWTNLQRYAALLLTDKKRNNVIGIIFHKCCAINPCWPLVSSRERVKTASNIGGDIGGFLEKCLWEPMIQKYPKNKTPQLFSYFLSELKNLQWMGWLVNQSHLQRCPYLPSGLSKIAYISPVHAYCEIRPSNNRWYFNLIWSGPRIYVYKNRSENGLYPVEDGDRTNYPLPYYKCAAVAFAGHYGSQ